MKYIAAYALLVLGGNTTPSDDDVKKLLQEVGCEVNQEDLTRVTGALKGKQLHELVTAGSSKLATLSFGGSGAAAPAAAATTKAEPAKAEKKEEKKEEEAADVGLGGGLFGDDEW